MNDAYIHLTLNHFPPIAMFCAMLVLLVGAFSRNEAVRRAGAMLIVLAAIVSAPVYFTGEGAEKIVKGLEGVNRTAIHPHEEAAEFAFVLMIVAGVAAIAALVAIRPPREMRMWVFAVLLLLTLLATAATIRTAFLGGRIHHPESEIPR
jgi:hypothetical protein